MELQQQKWMRLIALIALVMPSFAMADVLIEHVPPNAQPARVLAVVQSAFMGREWTVESVDADSVTARLNHNRVFVRMKVTLRDGQLLYETEERGRNPAPTNPAQSSSALQRPNPDRWVRAIRKDIERLLPIAAS